MGKAMRLVLVGPPGSGKGTQAELLTERLGLRVVGTGNILREAIRQDTPAGRQAKPFLKLGQLVPDDLVNRLVADLFESGRIADGVCFDGYPRTVSQARWFDAFLAERGLKLDAVVQFKIDDEEVVRRISGRRVCPSPACGASYNIFARPPKVVGVCDLCSTILTHREDDLEATIRARLHVFHETADALVGYYEQTGVLRAVGTAGTPESIFADVLSRLPSQPKG
jgi:adenylate kinase